VLSQTLLEAPAWANEKLERAARRWAASGGQTHDPTPGSEGEDDGDGEDTSRWLDRASQEVEGRLGLGEEYLASLVRTFERRWRAAEEARAAAAAASPPPTLP
jgi:hypothetical protein